MQNSVLDTANNFVSFSSPNMGGTPRKTLHGLPLGVTTSGELAVKVILVGDEGAAAGQPAAPDVVAYGNRTTNFTVPQGTNAFSFQASDDFVGTLGGTNLPAGTQQSMAASAGGVLPAFVFTISAGNIFFSTQTAA